MTSIAAQSEQISAGGSEQDLSPYSGGRQSLPPCLARVTPPLHSTSQCLGTSLSRNHCHRGANLTSELKTSNVPCSPQTVLVKREREAKFSRGLVSLDAK
ncbi:hypothetical protein ALC56_04398 [Trachymyrmex septentrionalis]|uniref:Uncharacterized protein n=1 Tax=Trachymyrmex septentrionalis TaxID=34720 RepID=A0A195FLW8_9HYME|nr:hypothetical protein ALC56_04398 [Trachymyrmex septentrionalis]